MGLWSNWEEDERLEIHWAGQKAWGRRWESLWVIKFRFKSNACGHVSCWFSCLVLFCPLHSLQEENESINRMVRVADVTVLYGPPVLQGLVWGECRTENRRVEGLFPVTAHCCEGIQPGSANSYCIYEANIPNPPKIVLKIRVKK